MKLMLFCFLFGLSHSQLDFYKLPQFKTCRRSDPELNECLKSAIQNAVDILAEGQNMLNFPLFQPIEVPHWLVDPGPVLNFDQTYSDIYLFNHTKSTVNNVQMYLNESDFKLSFDVYYPGTLLKAKFQYTNATLVDIALNTGNFTFIERDYNSNVTVEGDLIEDNGRQYLYVKNVRLNKDPPLNTTYGIETGDEEHDEKVTQFLNNNTEALNREFEEEFKNIYQFGYHSIIDAFFATIPFDQLFPQ